MSGPGEESVQEDGGDQSYEAAPEEIPNAGDFWSGTGDESADLDPW